MNNPYKNIVYVFASFVLCCLIYLIIKRIIFIIPASSSNGTFTDWISIIIASMTILVAILLTFNILQTLKIMGIGKKAEERTSQIPELVEKLKVIDMRIKEIESSNLNILMKEYLIGLKSKDSKEKEQAIIAISEIGISIHIPALESAYKNEKDPKIKENIRYAIGRLEKKTSHN